MHTKKIWNKILSPGEEIKFEFSLGPRYISLAKNFFISLGVLSFFLFKITSIFFIFSMALIIFGLFWGWYLKRANNFAFTQNRILILRGWLSTHLTSVDYDKITDVRVEQPFFDKVAFKTGRLIINTAGTHFPEIVLVNIENPYEIKKKLDEIREKSE